MVGSSILQVPGSNKRLQFLKHYVKSVSFDMASPPPDGCWRMTTRAKPTRPASFSPGWRTCRSQNPSPSSGMSEDWLFNQKRNSTENRLRCCPAQTQEIASALSRNYRNLLRTHTGRPHPQSSTQASTATTLSATAVGERNEYCQQPVGLPVWWLCVKIRQMPWVRYFPSETPRKEKAWYTAVDQTWNASVSKSHHKCANQRK